MGASVSCMLGMFIITFSNVNSFEWTKGDCYTPPLILPDSQLVKISIYLLD